MANGIFQGSGTSASPYLVEDCEDLNAIRNNVTKYYRLTKNLDLATSNYKENWTPIPNFSGTFDGNYYNIHNLFINTTDNNVGLFADIKGGTVQNLELLDCNITGGNSVGSIAGWFSANNSHIYNVSVVGTITGGKDVGGILGHCRELDNCIIKNVVTQCNIDGSDDNVGGLIGDFTSTSETKPSQIINGISYSTITGNNFITTNGCIGLADNITTYTNLFYDKSKISANYPDEHAMACSEEYFNNANNFTNMLSELYITNNKKNYLWSIQNNYYPQMAFTHNMYHLFVIDSEYYYYLNDEFIKIEDALTLDIFYQYGIKDISVITAKALHSIITEHTFNVLTFYDTYKDNTNFPTLNIFYNTQVDDKELSYIIMSGNNSINEDYTPISGNSIISDETKDEVTTLSVLKLDEQVTDITETDKSLNVHTAFETKETVTDAPSYLIAVNTSSSEDNEDSDIDDTRTIQICNTNNDDYNGVDLIVGTENVTNTTNASIDIVDKNIYDEKTNRKKVQGNVYYNIYNTVTTPNRGIYVQAEGEKKSRYLISIDNGKNWLTYNSEEQLWVNEILTNIYDNGITKEQLLSRNIMNALPTDYSSKIKLATGLSSEAFNDTFSISDYVITFEDNVAPTIESALVTYNTDSIVVSAKLVDNENDNVMYRILAKHQIDTEYTQLTPANNGYLRQKNNYELKHKFDLSNFKNGANFIKIETKDARGATQEKVLSFTLVEGTPSITLNSNNQFYANLTLDHSNHKKVHFQIYINGEQKAPSNGGWTEWKETPYNLDYTWNTSDVLNGLPNEIEILVEDEMGTQTFTKFSVIGEYKSLLFKDENNFYYSTDEGEVLQQLDFGTVIGGVYSDVYKVYLENKTGLSMENITIYADQSTQEQTSKIKVSFDNNSFIPLETITYDKLMENDDVIPFYVRVDTDEDVKAYVDKVFKVLAKGDPIDTNLIKNTYTVTDYNNFVSNYNVKYDGIGLYNIKLSGLNDKLETNGNNIFIMYDNVYITSPNDITLDDFRKNPISDTIKQNCLDNYLTKHTTYQKYSIDWLNDFCVDNYGDTFENLKQNNKITYEAKLEYVQDYDGRQAYLAINNNYASVTHNWNIIE